MSWLATVVYCAAIGAIMETLYEDYIEPWIDKHVFGDEDD